MKDFAGRSQCELGLSLWYGESVGMGVVYGSSISYTI